MKKLSEYTSKDGKFVHQAKAGRYGGSKPDVQKPLRAPKNKDLDKLKDNEKKPELADESYGAQYRNPGLEKLAAKKRQEKEMAAKQKKEGVDESWSKGASSSNQGDRLKAIQHKSDAKRSLDLAKDANKDSSDHKEYMSKYHSSMAKHIKHAYHGGQYGSASEAKADHKYHTDKAKEYKSKIKEGVDEKLVGNQHKIDANKDGKITSHDFKKLRAKKKGETATMNPKMDNGKGGSMEQKETTVKSADKEPEAYTDPRTGKIKYRMVPMDRDMIKKESTIRQKLLSILEKKDPHTAGATPSEPMNNNLKGAGAVKMKKDHEPTMPEYANEPALDKKNFDTFKASGKKAPMRPNDKAQGDKNIINPVDDITKKAPKKEDDGFKEGGVKLSTESFMDKVVAYLRK